MAQTYSKSRQQAELAFQKAQAPLEAASISHSQGNSESDRLRAKTARLREARLSRDFPTSDADISYVR